MKSAADLTTGNIRRQLIGLALPLIGGNIFQQLYNTVDSFILGRFVGQTAFAAVGTAGSVMNLFIFMISGGCNGMSVLSAQLYGEGSWDALRRESFLSFSCGGLAAAALTLAGLWTLTPLLRAMQTPAEVLPLARAYLRVIYLGLPAAFLYNWSSAVLRAAGDTKAPLWILIIAMGLNALLDYLLVASCAAGVSGAALATVLSQLFAALVCLSYMRRARPYLLFGRGDMRADRSLLGKTIRYGAVSALHQSSLYIGKLFVQGAVNTGGTEIIAAYTAASRIEGFANAFGDSGGAAISVFVAQNEGAGNDGRVKGGFRTGAGLMALLSVCLSGGMVLAAPAAVRLLMGPVSELLAASARAYIQVIACFYILCYTGNAFVGLYRGLGQVHIPVLGTVLQISIRAALSYWLIGTMGLAAVAWATGIGWVAVVLFQCLVYKRAVAKRP